MKNVIKVTSSSEDRFRKILRLLSTLMNTPLSDKEIDVTALIHKHGGVVNTEVRKAVREKLEISVEYMNNYVSRLREKKILVGDRLHKSISSIDISDETKPYLLLFQFLTNEEHASSDTGSGKKTKRK